MRPKPRRAAERQTSEPAPRSRETVAATAIPPALATGRFVIQRDDPLASAEARLAALALLIAAAGSLGLLAYLRRETLA